MHETERTMNYLVQEMERCRGSQTNFPWRGFRPLTPKQKRRIRKKRNRAQRVELGAKFTRRNCLGEEV